MYLTQLNLSLESAWPLPYDRCALRSQLERMLDLIPDPKAVEIDLLILDNTASSQLNQTYLQASGPTNILSFPLDDPKHLGCLALCLPMLYTEAKLYNLAPEKHALNLLAHGLLHLLGYDHGLVMDHLQQQLCQQ